MSRALIPGSFDPITVGHVDIITRTAAKFDDVFVAVMTNDMTKYVANAKVKRYMYTMEERKQLAELACAHLPNVTVVSFNGMLIDLVNELQIDWIIKGLRNTDDYLYEQAHALWNRAHNPKAETLYLPCDPAFDRISSSLVRQTVEDGGDITPLVVPEVAAWMTTHPRR